MHSDGHDPVTRRRLVLAMVVTGIVATLAALPAAAVPSTYGADAAVDEPHYLLTAISLIEDGDLDVGDELDEARWRVFHDATLPQQAGRLPDGRRVAPHDPLLPALLAVPYRLGGLPGARWFLAAINGLLAAATLHLAVRRFATPLGLSVGVAVVAAASVPFVVYGAQIYPELPAALAVVLAVDAGLAPPDRRSALGVVLAVVALPWLAVKYAPVAAVLALLHLLRIRRRREHLRLAVAIIAAYVLAGTTYVLGHLAWYGGVTVYAAGDFFQDNGGQLSVIGTNANPLGRARRLVGLLVDRSFGVAAWQPAWLLLAPALGAIVRRRPPAWWWLALPLLAGWLNATFVALTMHGFWFPGRQIVHVLPLGAVAVTVWLSRSSTVSRAIAATAAVLGLWSTAALLVDGLAGELTWVVDFANVDHPGYRAWRLLLPDHLVRPAGTVLLTVAWTLALSVTALRAGRGPEWRADQPLKVPTSSEVTPSAS